MRGKFITFEGGEGAGKSTQAEMVARRLESFGLGVLLTRAPGGSLGGEIIRHVLLSGAAKPLGPEAEAMLFVVAREDLIKSTIQPALAAGKWVVCDRFADFTRTYQEALGEVDQRFITALERKFSLGNVHPDLTIVLDVPVALGLERAALLRGGPKPDRFEAQKIDFHERLREAYLMLAVAEPERCAIIEASPTKEAVARRVWDTVNVRLEPAIAPLTFAK